MTRLYTLAFEASSIRERYARLHARVFSLRSQLAIPGIGRREDYGALTRELAEVGEQLAELRAEVDTLAPGELSKRAPKEIQAALSSYVDALGESVNRLEAICARLSDEQRGLAARAASGQTNARQDTIGYDHAVQEHRRRGAKLKRLFEG